MRRGEHEAFEGPSARRVLVATIAALVVGGAVWIGTESALDTGDRRSTMAAELTTGTADMAVTGTSGDRMDDPAAVGTEVTSETGDAPDRRTRAPSSGAVVAPPGEVASPGAGRASTDPTPPPTAQPTSTTTTEPVPTGGAIYCSARSDDDDLPVDQQEWRVQLRMQWSDGEVETVDGTLVNRDGARLTLTTPRGESRTAEVRYYTEDISVCVQVAD